MNTKILKNNLKLNSKHFLLLMMLLVGLLQTSNAQTDQDAIIGEWINDKKDGKFEIYKQDNKYYGKILWGKGGDTKDVKNPDDSLKDRELVGLTILKNFTYDGKGTWKDGTIYDPREGKTYDCKITIKNNNQINVRGFIGIGLFGRTEIWTRIK